jgi:queuine tRNA-ribosyltransferase
LPEKAPVYLMGVGFPEDLVEAVHRGVDLFDCVVPTRNARNGTVFTGRGKLVIKNAQYAEDSRPVEEDCPCYGCQNFSRAYLRHLFLARELLAYRLLTLHNLAYFVRLMDQMRKAVREGIFLTFRKRFFAQQEHEEGEND